jgi:AraC family transcriptional regulator, regulatory protein of adaptative response / methylated-DNA-[protein]-cysteine methyltransferase
MQLDQQLPLQGILTSISMTEQELLQYNRVKAAIEFIDQHFKRQPSLKEVSEVVHVSPDHFQRIFTDWAGVSPKKFLQFITLEHARDLIRNHRFSAADAAFQTGLSETGRLHELFVKLEGMTPAEYKNEGENLTVFYHFYTTRLGRILVASTTRGICFLAFSDDDEKQLQVLKQMFAKAVFLHEDNEMHAAVLPFFNGIGKNCPLVKLHVKGTPFQLKVWEALLRIQPGELTTYQKVAGNVGMPSATRAVGTAIGKNAVAYLIPCHRVIQSCGVFGNYRWGSSLKTALIGWEGVLKEQ